MPTYTPYPTVPQWPADFQGGTITGQYIGLDGVPIAGGKITLTASADVLLDTANHVVIFASTRPLTITLNTSGQIVDATGNPGVILPATDDPDISPTGWTYHVVEQWSGGRAPYDITLPQGTTVDLSVAAHVTASPGVITPGPTVASDPWLTFYASAGLDGILTGAITRNGNGAATSAAVVWPDGTPGTYTATTLSTAFPGAVDAYTVTYGSPVTKTVTQPAVTRSTTGAVTNRPAMTVAGSGNNGTLIVLPAPVTNGWLTFYGSPSGLDALIVGAITRNSNGVATSAAVAWPDGTPGTYTATTVHATPPAVDAYTVTYGSPATKTVTQPAVTRDPTTGAVTNRPTMTVS